MEQIDFLQLRFGLPANWLEGLELLKEQETIFVGTCLLYTSDAADE